LLAEATDAYNQTIVDRLARHVRSHAPAGGAVAILGVSYKPSSNVVEASQGLELALLLAEEGFKVRVCDPVALHSARALLGDRVTYEGSLATAVEGADVVLVANPDPAFADLHRHVNGNGAGSVIIDAWRLLRDSGAVSHMNYVPLGVGPPPHDLAPQLFDASSASPSRPDRDARPDREVKLRVTPSRSGRRSGGPRVGADQLEVS
jgi:UDPglucose 6-dehydrogenase